MWSEQKCRPHKALCLTEEGQESQSPTNCLLDAKRTAGRYFPYLHLGMLVR